MGRSVSYATGAKVITFKHFDTDEICEACNGEGEYQDDDPDAEEGDMISCFDCNGRGHFDDGLDFDMLIDDFRDHLKHLFPSVETADEWLGNEDHVLAENRLARFGMSEYCGLVSYWIVPAELGNPLANRWIDSIADKFVAAFGELTKVGSMSNGEGVYQRIDK